MNLCESFPQSFCALEYRPDEFEDAVGQSQNILIFVLFSGSGNLSVLVRPDWPRFVEERDREYIAEILRDFKDRGSSDPEGLFRHISSLSVGPLRTYALGSLLSDHPDLVAICTGFREPRKEDHEYGNDG